MAITIRSLTDTDLNSANTILRSAFQRAEDWTPELRLFRSLQPDGVFLACKDDVPAGMVAAILYPEYAYVGLMGIHEGSQRMGLGQALMEHLLRWASERQSPLVKLDASQAGQPLYEKLGFVPLDEAYVLQRPAGVLIVHRPFGIQPLTPQNLDLVIASDKRAFGADRSRLLRALLERYPERAFLSHNGYLVAQEKRIGPWIMTGGGEEAESLLMAALSLPFPGPVSVITPALNSDGIALLQRHRFQIVRSNRHMAYGSNLVMGQREKVYAQTSLSFG